MRQLHDRQHVQTDLPALGLARELGELAVRAHPRVVDEEVDRRLGGLEPRLDHRHPLLRSQVGGENLDRGPVLLLERLGELLEPGLVARDDHEVVAASGQRARERGADARRGAGDEDVAPLDLHEPNVADGAATGSQNEPERSSR